MRLFETLPRPLKLGLFVGFLFFVFACGSSSTQEAVRPTLRPTFTPTQAIASPIPPTDTAIPPTDTALPPTATEAPPTDTAIPPTDTALPPTTTEAPPTDTAIPPTDTALPPTATEAPPTDTPLPAPTQAPAAKIVIVRVFNSGTKEYVEIANQGNAPQNLERWTVSGSKGDETYSFPNYVLEAGATVRLHSGQNGVDAPPADIYWTTKNVWNNDGETVYLRNAQGNLVDEYKY